MKQDEGTLHSFNDEYRDTVTTTTEQFKRQMPRNFCLQVLSFATSVGIGILLTPYLVRQLGRAAYGLIPLAGMMTEYVSIITQTISSAVSRFLTIALQRKDTEDANRILNTAFFSYLALSLLQIPVFGLIVFYANSVFTIPEVLYKDAIALLICSAASFLIGLMTGVFGVPIYANNRLDISRALDVIKQVARVVGILALFMIYGPALRYIGYVDLTISVLTTIPVVLIGKRLAPELKLNVQRYDWRKLRQIMAMGGWLLVNYMGFLLFLRIDIWVCNRFITAEAGGEYAAVLQWSNLIRQAGTILSSLIGPMLMIYYARSEMQQLIRLSQLSVRIFCLALAIPVSILCVFSSSILTLWLGKSFTSLAPLMVIMLSHLTINVGVLPLFNINTALNRVKWPALVTCAMGVANLLLAILMAKYLNWGVYGVAIAGAIVLTLKNALFTPVYAAMIMRQPWHTFIKSSASGLILLIGLIGFGCLLGHFLRPASWIQLVGLSLVIGVTGVIAVWFILPSKDRHVVFELAPLRVRTLAIRFLPV